jgi:RNA polymerase sigma factor (sigma-70 family)
MTEDYQLLRDFLERGREAAFAEVVFRHTNLVYSAALRQTGDAELAKDVTQSVFILLARKARTFRPDVIVPAWLCQTTRLVVANQRKIEGRRLRREIKAAAMSESSLLPEDTPTWQEVAPLLDDTLARLTETDRKAVQLHFLSRRSHREIGLDLGLKEDAVRKRIGRALERMRVDLLRHQVRITGPALGACLLAHGVEAAPAGLAAATAAVTAGPVSLVSAPVSQLVEATLDTLFWARVKTASAWGFALAFGLGLAGWLALPAPRNIVRFSGLSDASAALGLEGGWFVVADDEVNPLRLYAREAGGPPVASFDFSQFLKAEGKQEEADWEGAARIGQRTYWITSHGQNRKGRNRPGRHRFFAADIQWLGARPQLVPAGKPYTNLLADLVRAPQLASFEFAAAAKLAPKTTGALNIEGLCAMPEGHLLIGFRNPIPQGKALLVPLLNPDRVIEGQPAAFGDPLLLDLGGLGVRDLAWAGDCYLVLAGPFESKGECRLYAWAGPGQSLERCSQVTFKNLTAEALVLFPDQGAERLLVLSDDGTRTVHGRLMKELPIDRRSFRGLWCSVPPSPLAPGTPPAPNPILSHP